MARFSPQHDTEIFDICATYLAQCDQVFPAVIDLFVARLLIVLVSPSVILKILAAPDCTWVQHNATLRLITRINEFEVAQSVPEYRESAIDFVFTAAFSPSCTVAETAG
jgi:hypothetical protein